jgi:hypothetical protein
MRSVLDTDQVKRNYGGLEYNDGISEDVGPCEV